ncbi:hypothetical protein ACQW5G_01155 [Fructilactobacillus sp. Tb1]|uniref:hypothetical protein n=1 Tax=Fructilactobacillus sp. Tb1 TaxID=3422304 RepID=UPI003D2AB485
MTISEYYTRLEAYQLKQVDIQKNLALQSWFNQSVQATTGSSKNPKPKYTKFDKFFDAVSQENKIRSFFDPDYKPAIVTENDKQEQQAKLFVKRQREWEAIQKKGGK